MNNDRYPQDQPKPTVEQVAWVFAHINDHLKEPDVIAAMRQATRTLLQVMGGDQDKNIGHLRGQDRPTLDQMSWVYACIRNHAKDPATFRYLINERMGFPLSAYQAFYEAGGQAISNACVEMEEAKGN